MSKIESKLKNYLEENQEVNEGFRVPKIKDEDDYDKQFRTLQKKIKSAEEDPTMDTRFLEEAKKIIDAMLEFKK